jgi:hypothetical protein
MTITLSGSHIYIEFSRDLNLLFDAILFVVPLSGAAVTWGIKRWCWIAPLE